MYIYIIYTYIYIYIYIYTYIYIHTYVHFDGFYVAPIKYFLSRRDEIIEKRMKICEKDTNFDALQDGDINNLSRHHEYCWPSDDECRDRI